MRFAPPAFLSYLDSQCTKTSATRSEENAVNLEIEPAQCNILKFVSRHTRTRSRGEASWGRCKPERGPQVPQRGCRPPRTAIPPFHPNSYSARTRTDIRLFTTKSDPCGGRARTKRGARWLKPSYVMIPCDFQKDSMLPTVRFLTLKTQRVISMYIPAQGILNT